MAAQFQGAANTFTAVFEFDFRTALFTGVVVVVTYTWWGGFWAVSITDAVQAVLMLVAAILLPLVALQEVLRLPEVVWQAGYLELLGGEQG